MALGEGYTHESFWDQTSRTLSLAFSAKQIRMTREHNERMQLAWHTAELTRRRKRLPPLKSLLVKTGGSRKQTWQQQMAVMDQWVVHTRRVAQQRQKSKKQKKR